jgi:hypothetical protein
MGNHVHSSITEMHLTVDGYGCSEHCFFLIGDGRGSNGYSVGPLAGDGYGYGTECEYGFGYGDSYACGDGACISADSEQYSDPETTDSLSEW